MKTAFKYIFLNNWPRKLISIILAVIIWFVVDQTLTVTKTIGNIGVRIVNVPKGKTVEGIGSDGLLNRKITLTITGNRTLLEDLTSNDLEVVIDASGRSNEWVATIDKNNLVPLNPDVKLSGISKITHKNFIIRLTKLVSEKVPVIITEPIGESPKGYQFLDIWPYQLYITIKGPEEAVKKQKIRGLKLTFNLNDISKAELDDLQTTSAGGHADVVSFFVPNHWKQIYIPSLSDTPLQIDDPDAKYLRIDFIRSEALPIENYIPISLFYPLQQLNSLNPQKIQIKPSPAIEKRNGLYLLSPPFYVRGVSQLFLEIVRDMLAVNIIVAGSEKAPLEWNVQVINSKLLENRYVKTLLSDVSQDKIQDLQPQVREEYYRNRFRNFVSRLQLYRSPNQKLDLNITLEGNAIQITEPAANEEK
ncbi:MAG: hypothetical protein Tsb0015_11760 [Simkaniaceae bacterium]